MGLDALPDTLVQAWTLRTKARDLAPWRDLFGPHVPEDFGRVREGGRAGFLAASPEAALAASNTFEHFVLAAQSQSPIVLRQAFCGVWFVAEIPAEGDSIVAHFHRESDLAQIARLDHETGFFYGPIAADVPTFDALADLAARAGAGERIDGASAFEPLINRFTTSFPLSLYLDVIAPAVKGTKAKNGEALARWLGKKLRHKELQLPSNLLLLQERSEWIVSALVDGRVDAVPEAQLEASAEAALVHPLFAGYPPAVLYWLWRAYLLGEDDLLERVVALVRSSASRLIRDAVTVIDEARRGARSLGAVSLPQLRSQAMAVVARMRDPFPARFEIGPIVFERRDELASGLEVPRAPEIALPDLDPDGEVQVQGRFTVPHPEGRWVLTSGLRRHPRAGRHPSIPTHENVLLEVAPETGEVRVLAVASYLDCDAWYVTPDLIAVHNGAALALYERHGERAWLTESVRLPQRRLWRSADGRTIVALGGLELGSASGREWTPERVEVVRIDGRHIVPIGSAVVPLSMAASGRDAASQTSGEGALVVTDESRRVAYVAEGVDRVAAGDLDGSLMVVRPTCFAERDTPVRVGPNAVLDALGAMDISAETTGEHCLVLRGKVDNTFDVMAGDKAGVFPLEPPLSGGTLYWDILDTRRALVTLSGVAHVVDLAARTARRVVELGTKTPLVVKTDDGCAGIEGDDLVLYRSAPDGAWPVARRVTVGPGAAIDWCYLDGRVLAVARADCPLIVLAVREGDLWLLGAADPGGPLAGAQIASVAHPNGFWRLLVKAQGRPVTEAQALERAWAHAVETRPPDVIDAIGAAPWLKRPIRSL